MSTEPKIKRERFRFIRASVILWTVALYCVIVGSFPVLMYTCFSLLVLERIIIQIVVYSVGFQSRLGKE